MERASKGKSREWLLMPDEDWAWVEKQAKRRDCSKSEFICRLVQAEKKAAKRVPGGEALIHRVADVIEQLEGLKDDVQGVLLRTES